MILNKRDPLHQRTLEQQIKGILIMNQSPHVSKQNQLPKSYQF